MSAIAQKKNFKNNNYKKKMVAAQMCHRPECISIPQVLDPIWRTLGLEAAIGKMTMI